MYGYQAVANVDHGISVLDGNPDVAFTYVPIKPSARLESFMHSAREMGSFRMSGAITVDEVLSTQQNVSIQALPVSVIESARYNDIYNLTANPDLLVDTQMGGVISLSPERQTQWEVGMVALQVDGHQMQDTVAHKDNSCLTVNFYAHGKGIKYRIYKSGSQEPYFITMKSPVVTIHRGEAHPLGADYAVDHTGQDQCPEQGRVNVFYTLSPMERIKAMERRLVLS